MCERVPNLDLRFFVTSVSIQRQTGGDLAEILDKIGYVIRERYRILGQVKALTGEGRLRGVVLIALPFALFGFMLHIKPDYVEKLWTDPLGIKMSVAALVLQIARARFASRRLWTSRCNGQIRICDLTNGRRRAFCRDSTSRSSSRCSSSSASSAASGRCCR